MTKYETLISQARQTGVKVYEWSFDDPELLGLYCDGHIAVEKTLPEDAKVCTLAEELGHHHTSVGDITDQNILESRKQEKRARRWAHKKLIPLEDIVAAATVCKDCERWELAQHLGVTDQFLCEAIEQYREIYGEFAEIDGACIYFEPLTVALYDFDKEDVS